MKEKIRKATNADGPAIKELVFSILRAYGLEPDPDATDRDLDDIETHYLRSQGWFAILESNSRIMGCYGLFRIDQKTCELRKMYLDPECRGKGYGKTLMEDALKRAKELGFLEIILETASVLKEAIGLYQKYGFEPHQPNHLSPRCDQAYRKILSMSFDICEATEGDADAIADYFKEFYATRPDTIFSRPEGIPSEAVLNLIRSSTAGSGKLFLFASSGGKVVGTLTFSRHEKAEMAHAGEFGMSVDPRHQRQGIATALLQKLETWAADNGIERIELQVWSNNPGAQALYEKTGYHQEGRRIGAIRQEGRELDIILMAKRFK